MSWNSNINGRAYEFAWMEALYNALSSVRKTRILYNSSYDVNRRAWDSIDEDLKELMRLSAESAVQMILEMEPLMTEKTDDELILSFQNDQKGKMGDVRDILVSRPTIEWEIGLSCKHNHEAVKHSRLSHKLDFGNVWFGVPCSKYYWNRVTPIFNRLQSYKEKGMKWSDLHDKNESVYMPLLKEFIAEINRAYSSNPELPKKMVEYLVGVDDYYKTISHNNKRLTVVRTFNMHGSLNKHSDNRVSSITVPLVELPTKLIDIQFKDGSKNRVEMYLNNGWQLSFRIHNASTKVEPSLKFDIQFIGMPVTVLNIECRWNSSVIDKD